MMRKLLVGWVILACSLGLQAQHRSKPVDPQARTEYEVRYKWGMLDAKVATGVLTLEAAEWEGQPATLAVASIRSSSILRLFLNEEYKGILYLTPDQWAPLFYTNPIRYEGRSGGNSYTFDRANGIIRVELAENNGETGHRECPLEEDAHIVHSLVYYARTLDMEGEQAGASWPLRVFLSGDLYPAVLEFQGRGKTRDGFDAYRYCLHMTERGLMENGSGNEIYFWVEPGGARELLALRLPLNKGEMRVKLVR